MKKLVLPFFVLAILFICPSFNIAQDNPGKFLKFTSIDADVNAYKFLSVADIDGDNRLERMFLFMDTLMILSEDSIAYYQAFNPILPLRTVGMALDCYTNQNGESILYMSGIHDNIFTGNIWTSFLPASNSFNYGYLSDEFLYGFSINSQGSIWHIERDSVDFERVGIFRSTGGFLFSQMITYLGGGDSSLNFVNGTFRHAIYSSPHINNISTLSTGTNLFNIGNPGGAYLYYSTDNGLSWIGESIIRGTMGNVVWGQIFNRDMAPYVSPFNDYWCVIDNNGIVHISLYGTGESVQGQDTLQNFCILYWNSRDKNWSAVSDIVTEGFYDKQGNAVGTYAPGWGAGQCLPMISISKDGKIVIIGWSTPEYLGEPGSQLNIFPGDGGQFSKPVYYTDLLANISYDGGRTWSSENIFPLKNQQSVQEQFLNLNNYLIYDPVSGRIKADYVYLIDEIPGASYFGNNSISDSNALFYDSLVLYTTPVEEEKFIVYDYSLSQNYPNPFNPNTKITYSIATLGRVTLKIYDILGREVTTLVNEEKPAGQYELNFNASQLASGVYFYRLQAGSYVQTKKMILLK